MFISSAKPRELIDWFHNDARHQQIILCILIAPAASDQKKLSAIIEDAYHADAMLGQHVAFLLLHPDAKRVVALNSPGTIQVLQGSAFLSPQDRDDGSYRLRDTPLFRNPASEHDFTRQEMAKQSAGAMARFTPELMEIFEVSPRALPSLCILVRGLKESVVIPLDKDWSVENLLALFAQLQNCVSEARVTSHTYDFFFRSLPARLADLENDTREFASKKEKVEYLMTGLLSRHKASDADVQIAADFLANENRTSALFAQTLKEMSIANSDGFMNDARIEKIKHLLDRLAELEEKKRRNAEGGSVPQSVSDHEQALTEHRARILVKLQAIRNARLVTTMAKPNKLDQIERRMTDIDRIGGIAKKGVSAIESLRKVMQFFGHS